MGSKGTNTTVQKNEPNPIALSAYKDLISRAKTVTNQPVTPYAGNLGSTAAQPYLSQATDYATRPSGPITPEQIAAYQNPYVNSVVDATRANMQANNVQQRQALTGNAITRGAFGGDREAVAQAELARQQSLADNQTISGLYSQGYTQALGAAQQDAARQQQGNQFASSALTGIGSLAQSSDQYGLDAGYQEFLRQQNLPYQQLGAYTSAVTGAGAGLGGTTSQTTPKPSVLSQVAGTALAVAPFFLQRGGRVGYASGGVVPEDDDALSMLNRFVPALRSMGSGMARGGATDLVKGADGVHAPQGFATGGFPDFNDRFGAAAMGPNPILLGGVPDGGGVAPSAAQNDFGPMFSSAEQKYGLPAGYLSRTAGIESSMNPQAKNPSGASGLFQFMPETSEQYGLGDPFDPMASTDAAARLAADNTRVLTARLGRPPTPEELYLAHQQGATGAANLLMNPDAPASSIIGDAALTQNGGDLGMTADEFARHWIGDKDGAGTGEAGGFGGPPIDLRPTGSVQPEAGATGRHRLPDDVRTALIMAGLGILSQDGPNAGANIGKGAMAGLQYLGDQRKDAKADALAERQFQLDTRRVDLAAEQLQQEATLAREKLAADSNHGMFEGHSAEAQGLNYLVGTGELTPEQAASVAAGKTVVGPDGSVNFLTPQGIFSQSGPAADSSASPPSSAPPPGVGREGVIPVTPPKTATEGQANAATFADRLGQANDIIEKMGLAGTDLGDTLKAKVPILGNYMISPEYQRLDQAQRNFINAQLRRESGAAIGVDEFENARLQYFPQPGDGPEVLEQKRQNRLSALEGMRRSAGPTYQSAGDPAPQAMPEAAADASPSEPAAAARPRATNPATGETVEWDGAKWIPVQ